MKIPSSKFLNSQLVVGIVLIYSVQAQLFRGRCYLRCQIPLEVNIKCGSNGVSYQNMRELLCAKKLCYPDLVLVHNGMCSKAKPLNIRVDATPKSSNLIPGPSLTYPIKRIRPTPNTNPPSFAQNAPEEIQIQATNTNLPTPTHKKSPIRKLLQLNAIPSNASRTGNEIEGNHHSEDVSGSKCLNDCVCGLILFPVCGSNKITYGNQCVLDCVREACEPDLTYHHDGFCDRIFFGPPLRKITFFRLYSAEKGIIQ